MNPPILDRLAALTAEGRFEEALTLSAPLAAQPDASSQVLADHSALLKAVGRREEALAFDHRAIARIGARSGVPWHNLAATLGDLGRGRESREACEKAFALGLDAAETWGVYARALLAVGEHDAAEDAYRQSLARAGNNTKVAAEYADILWMRRGEVGEALAVLDSSFRAGGAPAPLVIAKARLLAASGDPGMAADLLGSAALSLPHDATLGLAAAQAAVEQGRLVEAEAFLKRAQGRSRDLLNQWAIVHLAAGRPAEALAVAREGLALYPGDQSLLGWAATAARAAGDPLYAELCDYPAMVGVYDIDPPAGWSSQQVFLADLAAALGPMHVYQQHPSTQSLRHGSQTTHLLTGSEHPAIQGFFRAVAPAIREHMARLAPGRSGDYR
ncbi:MAG: tetratricopeptide repeat protein, partial [Phenylobacterium sp.]